MNKQDKDKILEIAQLCNNNYEECKTCRQLECDNRGKYVGALKMAAWKEQQMIENAVYWIGKNCIKYNEIVYLENNNNVPTHIFHLENFIEDFKKYMEEN